MSFALLAPCLCMTLYAQSVDFHWAKSAGGTSLDYGQKVVTDGMGNIYVTGYFLSDSISFGSTTLTREPGPSGSSAIFLVKYDLNGNVLWAKSAGGKEDDISNGISIDGSGNVFITGGFQSDTITFDTTMLINASTGSSEDVFIVKYDPNGNLIWAKSGAGSGGTPRDEGNGIATDGSGNVYVTGYFRSQSITFGTITLTNAVQADIFIVKYDANGNVIWAKREGGGGGDVSTGITVDGSGSFYISGHFYSNSITFGSTTLTNVNNNDELFIAKYDTDGNPLWAKGASCIGDDRSVSLAADGSGNVIITGWFQGFPISFGSITIPNSGSKDIFIVKYDSNGNVLWAKSGGGSFSEESGAVATDGNGNVYVTGYFGNTITFGSISINSLLNTNIFIVKFNANGNAVWAKSTGGIDDERGNGIVVDGLDNVYVTGSFDSPFLPFGSDTLTNTGPYDVFIAKIGLVTGVEETIVSESTIAFPNPFTEYTTLRTAAPWQNATLTITNTLGQTVKEVKNISGNAITIYRDNLPNSIYVLLLTQDNKLLVSKKIVVAEGH